MKLPNFRLYETQATASLYLGIMGLLGLAALCFLVGWGFSFKEMLIFYSTEHMSGKLRPWLVLAAAGLTIGIGIVAGILGYRSLGQKRNNRQAYSWMGILTGAVGVSMAPVLYFVWVKFSEPLITGGG